MSLPSHAAPELASPDALLGALFLLALLCAVSGAVMAACSRKSVSALAGLSLCGLGQTAFFCFLGTPLLAAIQGMALFASAFALLRPGILKKAGGQEDAQSGKNKALLGALRLVVAVFFAVALVLPFSSSQNGLAPWLAHDLQNKLPAKLPGTEALILPGVLLLFILLVGIACLFALSLPRPAQALKTSGDLPPEP